MPTPDPAKAIKDALHSEWVTWGHTHPTWTATLHVDDGYTPTSGSPLLLVADDGGPRVIDGAWLNRKVPNRITIRLTAFAVGRTEARTVLDTAVDYVHEHRPAAISRIENVSTPLLARDGDTGAFLASITMPVIVRPITS